MSEILVESETMVEYVDYSFITPRLPIIRIWGSSEIYKAGLFISGVDDGGGCFTFTKDIKIPLQFTKDKSGNLTTATIGDFIFSGLGTPEKPTYGYIYISIGNIDDPDTKRVYTIYVYYNGSKAGTKFGIYQGDEKEPELFKNIDENNMTEMTDAEGHWLWLYRLMGPQS